MADATAARSTLDATSTPMNIKNIEVITPSKENPFGKLALEVEFPLAFDPTKTYPSETEGKEVVLSEKSVSLLGLLRDSVLEDINASK